MGFGQAISHVFSNITTFNGRASRSEFWWWILFTYIVNFVVSLIDNLVFNSGGTWGMGFVTWIVWVILTIATLAVGCRRLHDTGKSGWLQLLWLLPCVGPIILIIFWVQASQGPNQYGDAAATA